jgi:SH3-like domain-containing protein
LQLEPSIAVVPTVAAPAGPQRFVVFGTDGAGLFLRAGHDTNSQALATLPDGTQVEQIGEDFAGPDRVWRNVRTADGLEGWVAVDYLEAAP